jgi:hypothetical protein
MSFYDLKDAEDWGQNYYCVKVPKSVSPSEEIYVYADNIQVGSGGDLNFCTYNEDQSAEEISLTISASNWKAIYLADKKRGTPMSVHRWKGEIKEVIIEEIIETVGDNIAIDTSAVEDTFPGQE